MSRTPRRPPRDPFDVLDADDVAGFESFVELLEPCAPPPGAREALLARLDVRGRFEPFAASVASLLDVSLDAARAMLDAAGTEAPYEPGPFPSVGLYHVQGGERVRGAITGFVRIPGGAAFPTHAHLGEETVLVVSGSMLEPETGRIVRPGEIATAGVGAEHTTVARPGPDLVYLAVLFEGLRVGDAELRADDPRL